MIDSFNADIGLSDDGPVLSDIFESRDHHSVSAEPNVAHQAWFLAAEG